MAREPTDDRTPGRGRSRGRRRGHAEDGTGHADDRAGIPGDRASSAHSGRDVLTGGGSGSGWLGRLTARAGGGRARLLLRPRHRPWLVALAVPVAAAVALAGAAAWTVTRPDPPSPQESLPLDRACRLVLAYRGAEVGPAVLAAREDLR